jgi:hypothetical protein
LVVVIHNRKTSRQQARMLMELRGFKNLVFIKNITTFGGLNMAHHVIVDKAGVSAKDTGVMTQSNKVRYSLVVTHDSGRARCC